jgi:hypothetical protein
MERMPSIVTAGQQSVSQLWPLSPLSTTAAAGAASAEYTIILLARIRMTWAHWHYRTAADCQSTWNFSMNYMISTAAAAASAAAEEWRKLAGLQANDLAHWHYSTAVLPINRGLRLHH